MKMITIHSDLACLKRGTSTKPVKLKIGYSGPPELENFSLHSAQAFVYPGRPPINVLVTVLYTPGAVDEIIGEIKHLLGVRPLGIDNVQEVANTAYQLGAAQLGIKP